MMPLTKPSAPKLSFKSKQHSTDGVPSISIRFNASSVTPDDDDDDDINDVTIETPKIVTSKVDVSALDSMDKTDGKRDESSALRTPLNTDLGVASKELKPAEKPTYFLASATDKPDLEGTSFSASSAPVRRTLVRRATTENSEFKSAEPSVMKAANQQPAAKLGGVSAMTRTNSAGGRMVRQTWAGGTSKYDDRVDIQSAPTSHVTTPQDDLFRNSNSSIEKGFSVESSTRDFIPQMSQVSQEEERSLFSGIKERLQDRFHDNISAVIEKIEEISSESKIGGALERRLRKSDSLESNKSYSSTHSVISGNVKAESLKKSDSKGVDPIWSRDNSVENDVFEPYLLVDAAKTNDSLSTPASKTARNTSHVKMRHKSADNSSHLVINKSRTPSAEIDIDAGKSRTHAIEFNEDFYAEPADDYFSSSLEYGMENVDLTGKSPPLKTHSLSQWRNSVPKQSRFSLRSTKYKAPPPPIVSIETSQSVPVSMSALLNHTEKFSSLGEDPDEDCTRPSSLSKAGSREYYDTKDDSDYKDAKLGSKREPSPISSLPVNEPVSDEDDITKSSQEDVAMTVDKMDVNIAPELSHFPVDITQNRVVIVCACVALYIAIPLPSFISGLLCGAFFATLGWLLFQFVTVPPRPRKPFVAPDIKDLPRLAVPKMRPSNNDEEKFKGWMNELQNYDPDNYHISKTKSVFVQLEGTNLRLQTPKVGVAKRAIWSDPPITNVSFIKQRHFDLTGSKVDLLPPGLVRKRLWSKKYPICIVLKKLGKKKTVKDATSAKNLGFEVLPHELCEEGLLFLFARTGREKEEWYRRFTAATQSQPLPTQMTQLLGELENQLQSGNANKYALKSRSKCSHSASVPENITDTSYSSLSAKHSSPSFESGMSEMTMIVSNKEADEAENEEITNEHNLLQYLSYMSKIMPADTIEGKAEDKISGKSEENTTLPKNGNHNGGQSNISTPSEYHFGSDNEFKCDRGLLWANAGIARLFLDFLREQYWAGKVKEKIEKKLSKIHVPYFIDTLTVTEIDLGSQMPIIQRFSPPYMDDRGLWFDLDIAYGGGFQMTLETKVNLMKLKKKAASPPPREEIQFYHKKSAVTNSDEEDSAESSTDEELEEENTIENGGVEKQTQGASKKLLRIVDKIAASKYFQQATDNKYVKKAMEGVSNTKLILTVEIESCVGTVSLNIPPPPTDRLWFGFRENPKLVLSAKPRIGQRDVNLTHITDWIEKKLAIEFQKVLVFPNMEDEVIPLMCDPVSTKSGSSQAL